MNKRLIAIALATAIAMPLMAHADTNSYFASQTHQVSVMSADIGGAIGPAPIVTAANDPCGSCHGADPAMQNANFERTSGDSVVAFKVTDIHESLLSVAAVLVGVPGGDSMASIKPS